MYLCVGLKRNCRNALISRCLLGIALKCFFVRFLSKSDFNIFDKLVVNLFKLDFVNVTPLLSLFFIQIFKCESFRRIINLLVLEF